MNLKYSSLIIVVTLIGFFCFFSLFSWFRADMLYARGQALADNGQLLESALAVEKAVSLWPREPAYHKELAATFARLASVYSGENKEKFAQFAAEAGAKAYKLNPNNLLTLKSLITTYYTLSLLDAQYQNQTLQLVDKSLERCPTDPTLWYLKGVVYSGFGKDLEAKEPVREA